MIHINPFLVYFSTDLKSTFDFILEAKRPDCWHLIWIEGRNSDTESDKLLTRISSKIPHNLTVYHANGAVVLDEVKERIVEWMQRDENEVIQLICSHGRNPLKCSDWMTNCLDSCYVHVDLGMKFPLCDESTRELDLETLKNWHFTALNRPLDELLRLTFRVFQDFDLLKEFGISEDRFQTFLLAINCNYFDNPYHNFYHVVDVLQCCYYLLRVASEGRLIGLLGPVHLFALLIGCLCHDLGHPSFGNNFLRDSEHPLALLFNDSSILENYHSMVLFSILRCPNYNWITPSLKKDFRKCVLGCILGTDMSNHFEFIKTFSASFPKLDASISELNSTEKIQLATALIKCSDISNVLRPFPIAKSWGKALLDEFFTQGDYEKVLGLPVGPLNDRHTLKTGPAQHQFLTIVAAPLYRAVAAKIDGFDAFFSKYINENAINWLAYQEND